MIPFIDLTTQQNLIRPKIDAAIKRVLDHGNYIMGPEIDELEKELANFCGVKHAITCSSGTDALVLGLMAKDLKQGDIVFLPSFTFAATAEAVAFLGAVPVFIDSCKETYNLEPKSLEQAIERLKKADVNLAGIITVDLFGLPADYDVIQTIADKHNLWMLADAAQSFGATYKGKKVGTLAEMTTTSFFPAKPLGCYGDGGAIFTDSDDLADKMQSLRVHGKGTDKYDNVRVGLNARMDTVQAAILLEKLKIFPDELNARQRTAKCYNSALKNIVQVPVLLDDVISAWAQYTICLPQGIDRDALQSKLKDAGIPSVVYYVKPLHLQTAYKNYPTATGGSLPVCEKLSEMVLSLPMSGYVESDTCAKVSEKMTEIILVLQK
jgi:dTDP-4-amino-4,6-dideoxygalactose transaminase